jgi:hypothetical protein
MASDLGDLARRVVAMNKRLGDVKVAGARVAEIVEVRPADAARHEPNAHHAGRQRSNVAIDNAEILRTEEGGGFC